MGVYKGWTFARVGRVGGRVGRVGVYKGWTPGGGG